MWRYSSTSIILHRPFVWTAVTTSLLGARVFSHHVPLSVIIVEEPEPKIQLRWVGDCVADPKYSKYSCKPSSDFLVSFFLDICFFPSLRVSLFLSRFLSIHPSIHIFNHPIYQRTYVPIYLYIYLWTGGWMGGSQNPPIYRWSIIDPSIHRCVNIPMNLCIYALHAWVYLCIQHVYLYPCVCLSVYLPHVCTCLYLYDFVCVQVSIQCMMIAYDTCTLWLFNIAMENGPFIDGLPIKNGDFPWLC